jgi:group II intron reverse transcriptase/maturase
MLMLFRQKLSLISRKAKADEGCKFNNLMHLINEWSLKYCFYSLKKNKAPGIDRVTLEEYEKNLDGNIEDLLRRMKTMSYRPQAVRRTYVPKDNGKQRPLGIPTIEDKMVQMAFTMILEAIWEQDFTDFSYGFRPKRNCHQALKELDSILMFKPVNYVIDADIKSFFDNVDHEWMKRFIEVRISDRKFIRYIVRFLKSGIVEEGKFFETEKGTPQGGVISPVLANIYLHYILDSWFVREVESHVNGYVKLIRYADDFVIGVEQRLDVERIQTSMRRRFQKFGLELSDEKTRVVQFGRHTAWNSSRRDGKRKHGIGQGGCGKPGTFSFLGFTHYCTESREGKFKVSRKTERKRFIRGLRKTGKWLKRQRNWKRLAEIWETVSQMLTGHYRYYGVSDNIRQLRNFLDEVKRLLFKWLNRRSQKRSFTWDSFVKYLKTYPLPTPRIYHNMYCQALRREQ